MTTRKRGRITYSWFMAGPNFSPVRALIFRPGRHGHDFPSRRTLILSVNGYAARNGREGAARGHHSGYIGHGAPQLSRPPRGSAGTPPDLECGRALQFFVASPLQQQTGQHLCYPRRRRSGSQLAGPIRLRTGRVRVRVGSWKGLGLGRIVCRRRLRPHSSTAASCGEDDSCAAQDSAMPSPYEAFSSVIRSGRANRRANAGTRRRTVKYGFGPSYDRAAYPRTISHAYRPRRGAPARVPLCTQTTSFGRRCTTAVTASDVQGCMRLSLVRTKSRAPSRKILSLNGLRRKIRRLLYGRRS